VNYQWEAYVPGIEINFFNKQKTLLVVLKVTSKIQCEKYYPFPRYKLNPQMVLKTLNFTLTVTLFAYSFKTDVGYSVWLTVDGK
jgi:hypothetical protein